MSSQSNTSKRFSVVVFVVVLFLLFALYYYSFYASKVDKSNLNTQTIPVVLKDSLLPENLTLFGLDNQDLVVPADVRIKSVRPVVNKGEAVIDGVFVGDFANEGTLYLSGKIEGKLSNSGKIKFKSNK